ncbi:hypothetical protein JKV81_09375 [Streptomyces sp. For3]|uniref:hypothetical protein n=1 Tax=Streptomyces silvae TaxID=2803812 RepID=UPI001921ECFD|nr:hypothetical protein [Streptomyces silvae]MBL1287055.1 hypothetical protein [Streptomyces silvae]
MSLIDGASPSADWIAMDMEAMLRECDALILSKDELMRHLQESVEALQREMAKASEAREQAVLQRQKAKEWLGSFQATIQQGAALRASQTQAPIQLRLVRPAPEPAPAPSAPVDPVRIEGARSIAAMRIISGDAQRPWSASEVARLLEGDASGAVRRTRCLLEHLQRLSVLHKVYSPDGKRAYYRVAASWEAA